MRYEVDAPILQRQRNPWRQRDHLELRARVSEHAELTMPDTCTVFCSRPRKVLRLHQYRTTISLFRIFELAAGPAFPHGFIAVLVMLPAGLVMPREDTLLEGSALLQGVEV